MRNWKPTPAVLRIVAVTAVVLAALLSVGLFLSVSAPTAGQPLLSHDEFIGPEIPDDFLVDRFEDRFPSRSNLQEVLLGFDFSPAQIDQLIRETRQVYNLNRVKAGNRYAVEHYGDGRFRQFEYDINDEEYLIVNFDGGNYNAFRRLREFETVEEELYGRIEDNLWNTLVGQGENGSLIMSLYEILQWDIAFTAIQPGDSFRLIFEKKFHRNQFVKYGDIKAIEFTNGGKSFYAFSFRDPASGRLKYYDADGKAVKKAFLKVPFKYDYRISSGFSFSRFHPVLNKRTPHLGVDFAAPRGTPVLASGAGRVVMAGRNGGAGNMVKIRHPNGYRTSYLHLSKILVRNGQSVAQGDRIGLVGSTGLATGSHLDYRVQDPSGKHLNPVKMTVMPSDSPVPKGLMEDFIAVRDEFLRRLNDIPAVGSDPNRNAFAG